MTRGDNIRRMLQTDGGLADFMIEHGIDDGIDYCKNDPVCSGPMDECGKTVPEERCRRCLIEWLGKERT